MKEDRIGVRAVLVGCLLSAAFAWYAVRAENFSPPTEMTATQIPVLPYLLLIFLAAVLNPLLKLLRIPLALAKSEIMIIFLMGMVSAGVATFGLSSQVVPLIGGLFNKDWNTKQARWDLYIEPYVNESFFISERGIRDAAVASRDAEFAWRRATERLRTARGCEQARAEVATLTSNAVVVRPDAPEGVTSRTETPGGLRHRRSLSEAALRDAEAKWQALSEGLSPGEALRSLPAEIEVLKTARNERRESLRVLEESAFAKTAAFRHGLPDDLRAIPGLLPGDDEPFELYAARLSLMRHGMSALRELRKADHKAGAQSGGAVPAEAAEHLRRAVDALKPALATAETLRRRDTLQEERRLAETRLAEAYRVRDSLVAERRHAEASEFERIDNTLKDTELAIKESQIDIQQHNTDLNTRIATRLAMAGAVGGVVTQLEALAAASIGSDQQRQDAKEFQASLQKIMDAFTTMGISWRQFFIGGVPWGLWLGPLWRWGGIVFVTYLVLMTLNVLIFRQWAHHEKLIYPLAELPLLLGGCDADDDGKDDGNGVPKLYRNPMFWFGFAVSGGVLAWNNLLVANGYLPGLKQIPLVFAWDGYIGGSVFSGLAPNAQHQIFFTVIGIAFLIPARISFSVWSFHLIYIILALCLVWLGLGVNLRSFPHDPALVFNFRNAMGGGAMVAFSTVILWKCRSYILCAFRPNGLNGLQADERKELRISSAIFLASSLTLILLLKFGLGSSLFFSVFCYLMVLLVTIGMVRAVAEGGLFAFQCWFNPFHVIRSVFGMNQAWTSASVLAPLAVFYYVIMWDIKTFIAPAMANALKIRDRMGIGRLKFHVVVFIAIGAATTVAIATHLIMAYQNGGDAMHGWFYRTALRDNLFGWIKAMSISNPVDTAGGRYWFLAGIIVMGLLIYLRRSWFWLPHPLGMVVWVNPAMWCLWFSFFLGWAFKTLVSRYGNQGTYFFFRNFFIGLIVGELVMCLFGVDLNRNWG